MKDNYIFYEANGKQYKISESDSAEFENDFPEAKVNLSANGKKYLIGIKEKEDFFNDFGADNVQYTSFEEKPQEINKETTEVSERPSWGKTIVKSAGSALSTLGKMFADAATLHAAGQVIDNPRTGEIYTMPDFDTLIKDESVPSVAASNRLRETAERLSKEADPTGGEKGFTDLISEGNVGMALQKGLATAIESAPMTLSAYNPYTMGLYMALNSASNFANETRENPEVDKVKRATMAIGSAAFEQAVEKFADPIFKYIGGGKAIGELTEDVAKEILEKGTKEATAGIAERIIRVLKNTGKDALGEGAEEVVTSFGNDALGQALDWIDGDQDYGIIAQWNQFKESNPNASESDFAKSKAKEYMDSFIGGALSGTYMSGTAQTAQEGFQYMADANIANKINNAKEYGSTLSYQDIYDSDDIVREANKRVSDAFTNKNGVSAFSEEFIGGLTSEKAFELSRTEGLPTEQRVALEGLAQAKAAQEGLNEKLDENLETAIRTDIERVESSAEDGVITKGVYGNRHVYVKGGVAKNGSITLPNGENGPVVIIDTATGEQSTVRSEDINNAMSEDATNFALNLELSWRESDEATREQARNTMSAKAKLRAIQLLEGKKVMVDLGSGLTEVNIQQILPESGKVIIKGKKGDLGGKSNMPIGVDVFYDAISRDDNGNPIITDGDIEVEDEAPDVAQTEVAVEDDFRGEVATILINGVPVDVEVISQDNPSDTIVYEYTDENGNTKRGRTTIGGFKSAIQQAEETSSVPEEPVAETPVAEEPAPVEEAPAVEETPVEETPLNPESIDWDALFEQDPEAYFVELQNQFGEETLDILNEEVDAAQGELDALAKAKTKSQNERLENRKKKAALQKRIEILNGMVARLTPAQDVAAEIPAEATPVEEVPETPADVTPDVPTEEPTPTEAPVAETPAEEPAAVQPEPQTVQSAPVAPNPVDNPIREAQKKEKSLATQLKRYDLTHELKQDLAFKAGKAVADFFATREEYEAYAENATDFGDYNEDFERGVDESFANRPQNTGNSPVNSVPLGTEPKGENNGEQGEEDGTSGNGPSVPDNSGRTTDGGTEGGDQTSPKVGKGKANKGKAGNKVADKYPARKGNATQKLLVDTFGFNKVEIPNSRKETLNTIYDFMMAMSKMLGISPKSIGQGGWLDVGSLRSNAQSSAEHSLLSKVIDQSVVKATLKYKYAKIKGLAHEWWHALDHALSYFETGKGKFTASEMPASRFTGRQETWYAVNQVIKAIKDSGHESRMFTLKFPRRYVDYLVEPTEMAARAFEEYMKAKFAAAGIVIDNSVDTDYIAQPTAEEMAVITPAFDNLFNVLQEKEGKTPGTSVLFHIGEMMEPGSEAWQLARETVMQALRDAGVDVVIVSNEDVSGMSPLTDKDGIVYGWTDGKTIYLTEAGMNPNTPIHEYTHIWARAMMQKNPKGWNNIKNLLRGTPVWNDVMNDTNYSNIHSNEDSVASEVLSRISGTENAAKLEQMAQQMIDEAKGTARKLEARGLIQRIKDALNEFWSWVSKNLFEIENFGSVEEVTDRVLWDLMNKTDLGELSEGQVETQIVTDTKVIAELEASPKRTGYRNVVQNEDGTFSSPMAYWLQNPDEGAKSRIATAKFEMGKWEEAEEHPEVANKSGYVTLVKPNKKTVGPVAYDPYIHNRLDPVNLQFKEAWKRDDLVYVETEVAETDLESGYHADKAKLPVGVHSWSNGAVMLSKYDKPVRVLPWEDVADAWAARLNGEGVEFDVVPPALLPLLVERGVEILPPHKNSGKDCENAYAEFKNAQETKTTSGERGGAVSGNPSSEGLPLDDRGHLSHNSLVHPIDLANVEKNTIATKAAIKKLFNRGSFKEKITDALSAVREVSKALKLVKSDSSLSYYSDLYEGDFEINGKIAHVRISGHPANGERMGNAQVDTKISLVIYDNGEHVSTGIHEGYVEYTYYPSDIDPEDAAWSIANGINSLLEGNGFVDNSGKAKEQPYPYNNGKGNFVYRKADAQNAAVDFLAGEQRLRVIENAVNEEAAKLGVSVTYKTRSEMPEGHKNDKGYYNTKTGEIVICTENASSIADAIQTILHEAVAHKGLRQLMGDKFNEFITRVYESLDAETKAKVDALAAEHYDGNTAIATEEYMASLAETEDFANNSLWEKIKSIFEDIINAILGRNDIKIGDNELRYILRASYNNMVNPRGMESMRVWAQDQMMREEYKINQSSPEILSRTGIDPTEVSRESAKAVYDKMVADRWQEFQRQFQDAMQPVRIAIDAIQQETGNLPIEDYENFILTQNQASSRSRVEMDIFARNYYSPIVEQVNNVIDVILEARGYDKKNRKKRSEVYAEIRQYLIAKHGLERNEYYQSTKTRKLTAWEKTKETDAVQKEYDEKVNLINTDTTLTDAERELQLRDALDELNAAIEEINTREVPDLRDYSGLTALFGMDPKKFREAEAEAQQLVDKFEAEAGSVTEEMWKKINAATDKTLRHSYESGMISRQQYNDIKAMFKFYIPLRGFDETTAEDVYSYARFEGNRFNPAVQSAGGRTSLADDPLAIIMNMAESEIAQGNKNRAKQALYNFILNRPLTDSHGNQVQNSLMQIENVWYIKNTDSDGNEIYTIAVPNHESGETYEEFENRMQALAAEDKAYKSKKGKVDVGMRFQKQQNRDAHYVYLKVNGVDKAIYINGDPKAADAINGVYGKPKGELAEKMGTLNRFISSTFTNYSLEFTARNYFRDMFYSHINIDVKEKDPAYRKKFRQNWRHNNLGTMMRMLKAYRAGEFDGRPLNEDEAAFVEFMANGGQTGYTVINSVENHKAELERAIKNMQNGIEKGGIKDSTVFKYTLGSIELLNEASELVTRFAAFKTSRDMGRGVETSINDAKEITVNFNTKGAQDGKGLFGAIAGYFGWSKFFFNASVQGVQNIKAMAEANKLKFCSTVGGVTAIGFLMPVFTSVIAQILGGDDDEYWNIPEYDRQNNFCIPLGNGKYAKIPLPIGFREVYAIGDMVAAMAWDKKFTRDFGQVGTDIANKIASVVLPINPLESAANGLSLWHTLLYTALPSSVQFAIQNATNIDWKGAPLQKEYTYNEDDPKWMKAFNSNPSWMVGLSKWCNEHIGAGDMKGWDWSPEKLDNTLSSVFGGVYNLVKKTGRSISMIWNEENRNLSNIPLSGVVLGSGIESDDRFMTDAYYDMNEYYDQRIGFIKRRAKTFGYSLEDVFEKKKGRHHPKMQEIYGNSEFEWMREWYFGNKDLDKVNDKIKKLKKEIEAKENPTQDKLNRLSRLMNEFEDERRDFVNDMLELD